METTVSEHYDLLAEEGNDPVLDPPELKEYMDKWDGPLFTDMLKITPQKKVLEIGCGTGRIGIKIVPFVKEWTGIDISPKTISLAKKHLPHNNVRLICADFTEYVFEEKFDTVYSTLTFMHIEDKGGAIEKIYEILAENGSFVLSVDKNQSSVLDFGNRRIKIYPDDPDAIIGIMKEVGFTNIEIKETEFAFILKGKK